MADMDDFFAKKDKTKKKKSKKKAERADAAAAEQAANPVATFSTPIGDFTVELFLQVTCAPFATAAHGTRL